MKGYAMLKIGATGWIEKDLPVCGPMDAICKPIALAPCINNRKYVFYNDIGYIEGDRGYSFPINRINYANLSATKPALSSNLPPMMPLPNIDLFSLHIQIQFLHTLLKLLIITKSFHIRRGLHNLKQFFPELLQTHQRTIRNKPDILS